MSHVALIRDNQIETVIIAEMDWAEEYASSNGLTALDTSTLDYPVGPGYVKDGDKFVEPESEPEVVEE